MKKKKEINYIKDPQRLIREKLFFNYRLFINENLNFKNDIKNLWMLDWFVGFVEAQVYNCWMINSKSTRHSFFLKHDDIVILYKIKKLLGFGKVKIYYKNNKIDYYKYIVNNKKGSYLLLLLFNGNLVLASNQKNFYIYYVLICKKFCINLNYNSKLNIINLEETAWLSGFFDERGFFFFNKNNFVRNFSLILLNENEYKFFSVLFFFKDSYLKSKTSLFLINNDINILFDYFLKFNLYTKKKVNLVRFKKLNDRLNNKNWLGSNLLKRRASSRFNKLVKFLNKKI